MNMPMDKCVIKQERDKQIFTALLSDDVPKFSSLLYNDTQSVKDSIWSDYELLCEAIKLGRRRVAHYLLNRGCCVFKLGSVQLPLHLAIERLSQECGWINIVMKLICVGARVGDRNLNGDNAVHLGFAKDVDGVVIDFLMRAYLEEEDGVNAVNKDELGVLHVACTRPKVEFVRQLLDRKANVNRRIPYRSTTKFAGYMPLHIAVECGNHEVAELLLKRGADVYARNLNSSTPLHLACYARDPKMIDLILAYDRLTANAVDNNGLSHFMVACTSSEPAFAKEHLRVAACKPWSSTGTLISSCTKNAVDDQFAGYTPLHFAAEFGSSGVIELLLAHGARCLMSGRMLTPRMVADKHGHEHAVRIFDRYFKEDEMCENVILAKKDDNNVSVYPRDSKVAKIVSDKGGEISEFIEIY